MNLKENAELVQYYLELLKLCKEEFIRNYIPSSWELLSCEERIQLATLHIHRQEQEDLEALLLLNQLNRELKEKKRSFYQSASPCYCFFY